MKKMIKNTVIAAFAVFSCLIITAPAVAGPSVWNQSGTYAAYIDFVAPGVDYASDKTVFFYEKDSDRRFRGTYFPLGAHLSGTQIGYLPANTVSIVEWIDNDTVLVETSNSWDETELTAKYKISVDGHTVFDGFDNLNSRNRDSVPLNIPDEWDFLSDSLVCEQFIADLCAGEIDPEESMPLNYQEWGLSPDQIRKKNFDCSEILPVRYIVLDFVHDSGLWVQCMWSYRFGIDFQDGDPVMTWYSEEDI